MRLRFDEAQRASIERLGDWVAYLGYAMLMLGVVQLLQCNLCGVVLQIVLAVLLIRAAAPLRQGTLDGLMGGLQSLSSFFMVRIVLALLVAVVLAVSLVVLWIVGGPAEDMQQELQQIQEEMSVD